MIFFLSSFIKWNFTKFVIDKNGQPVKRFGPNEEPNVSCFLLKSNLHDILKQ